MIENELKTNDQNATAEARGKRLKIVRVMAGLPRREFEEKYGISASTIQSWEAAKAGGLTKKGVIRILEVLKQEGVFCTMDWLLSGVGVSPQPTGMRMPQMHEEPASHQVVDEEEVIEQELLAFRALNPDTIDMQVVDDGMSPHFKQGDCVAGKVRSNDAIRDTVGLDCIVQTANNQILLRRVKRCAQPDRYDLVCTNVNTSVAAHVIPGQALISSAPVMWHRSRNDSK